MKLIFLHKSVSGHVETVELDGYPGVQAQIANGEVTCLTFDGWTVKSASAVVKHLLKVETPEFHQETIQKSLDMSVQTISKDDDLMIQTVWGYKSRYRGENEPVVDNSGDILNVAQLTKGVHHYMEHSREWRDSHTKKVVGHVVEAMVFDAETRKAALGLSDEDVIPDGPDGVLLKVQHTNRTYWNEEVKTGNKSEASLGGQAVRTKIQ